MTLEYYISHGSPVISDDMSSSTSSVEDDKEPDHVPHIQLTSDQSSELSADLRSLGLNVGANHSTERPRSPLPSPSDNYVGDERHAKAGSRHGPHIAIEDQHDLSEADIINARNARKSVSMQSPGRTNFQRFGTNAGEEPNHRCTSTEDLNDQSTGDDEPWPNLPFTPSERLDLLNEFHSIGDRLGKAKASPKPNHTLAASVCSYSLLAKPSMSSLIFLIVFELFDFRTKTSLPSIPVMISIYEDFAGLASDFARLVPISDLKVLFIDEETCLDGEDQRLALTIAPRYRKMRSC